MLKVAWAPRLLCRNDAFAEIVADRIVELARASENDPERLCTRALSGFSGAEPLDAIPL